MSHTRRAFVHGIGLGAFGLGLADLPQIAAATPSSHEARRKTAKSCILIFLWGGPSQIDTFDMKPEAPVEYRGDFSQIATSVPGVFWSEHLPLTASVAQHVALVRSLTQSGRGGLGDHHTDAYYLLTGHMPTAGDRALSINRKPDQDDWPFVGSMVAHCRPHSTLPSVVCLPKIHGEDNGYVVPGQFAGRLGAANEPLLVRGTVDPQVTRGFLPSEFRAPSLTLPVEVNSSRIGARSHLLRQLDRWQSAVETGPLERFGTHQTKAFSLLTSSETKRALDLSAEPDEVRQQYGNNINGQSALLARRLVEAGVPFVAVHWSSPEYSPLVVNWDTHADNFLHLRRDLLPVFDRLYSTLLKDLQSRGLLERTLVVALGEMGRTPRCDDPRARGTSYQAGRDHWPHSMFALLAGGGVRGGQVYGATDRLGGHVVDRPVFPEDLAATIYHSLGIAPEELSITSADGRPLNMLPGGDVIPLFS